MNIWTQICALLLLSTLFFVLINQPSLHLETSRAFVRFYIASFVCNICDLTTLYAIHYRAHLPILFVDFICKTYLCSLLFLALFAFLYVLTDIFGYSKKFLNTLVVCMWIVCFGCILIYCAPIYYYDNRGVIYSYGASVYATYFFAVGFLVALFYLLISQKSTIYATRWKVSVAWLTLWGIAATVQFLNNEILIVGYAGALGVTIVYLKLENPEMYMDKQTGLFNQTGYDTRMRELFREHSEFSMLVMTLERSYISMIQKKEQMEAFAEAAAFLRTFKDAQVFRRGDLEIVMVFSEVSRTRLNVDQIMDRFEESWGAGGRFEFHPNFVLIERADRYQDIHELSGVMAYAQVNFSRNAHGRFLIVDNTLLLGMQDENVAEKLIEDALANDWVEVFYQPMYNTEEGKFTTAEALVRIRDKDGNIIPPGRFIPIAEKKGSILRLGEKVFEKVCQFIKTNNLAALGIHYIEVNLSVVQCGDRNLANNFIRIMNEYRVPAECINLEITESASIVAKEILQENMKRLIDYGVTFSLDDFGTGQSNLNYIVEMPVNIVKFDRMMTQAYFESAKGRYVMEATMHMLQGMDLPIVSEGIETKEQFETMAEIGIKYIQGFYFSRPLPEEEFLEFIRRRNSGKDEA